MAGQWRSAHGFTGGGATGREIGLYHYRLSEEDVARERSQRQVAELQYQRQLKLDALPLAEKLAYALKPIMTIPEYIKHKTSRKREVRGPFFIGGKAGREIFANNKIVGQVEDGDVVVARCDLVINLESEYFIGPQEDIEFLKGIVAIALMGDYAPPQPEQVTDFLRMTKPEEVLYLRYIWEILNRDIQPPVL